MRTNDWPVKLALFFEEKRNQPFNWKDNNCCFFACDWVAICRGVDPAAPFRGVAAKTLVRFVREQPLATTIAARCEKYGFAEVGVAFAQRGDLVECLEDGVPALGVCNGVQSGFAGPEGLLFVATNKCVRAWRL